MERAMGSRAVRSIALICSLDYLPRGGDGGGDAEVVLRDADAAVVVLDLDRSRNFRVLLRGNPKTQLCPLYFFLFLGHACIVHACTKRGHT